ncbi:MAG TPA: Nre family DNA repair protein [Nitrososphaerales archaeon]|nr:Nre family DNA repair protein [Nitrososphaerales archaeon]HUK74483.1 Nre family DNA repair protein [Nitrososphaerales archaeon]
MCLSCRGAKLLCGKPRCPIIVKAQAMSRQSYSYSEQISGSSPPGVFVGRMGYPKVSIGPMVPPTFGDTSVMDTPEEWLGKPLETIVDYRYSLVRGNSRASVEDAANPGRMLQQLQELSMAARPVDSELLLSKPPRKILTLSEDTQPYGPSAPMERFKTSNVSVERRIEKAYYDRDLKAADAIFSLYRDDVLVTRLQRALSVGMFGEGARRRLVPTRWSITAVDSTISGKLIERIKEFPTIDEYRVYSYSVYDNQYVAILLPEPWRFEWIEAWFPNTTWNQFTKEPYVIGDYEEYFGRRTYARVGGCYYSTRLAVGEAMEREGRQAAAIVLRETYPGYIMPLGVWNVRESIRELMRQRPDRYDSFDGALGAALAKMKISSKKWKASSVLISRELTQAKITSF